MVIDWVTIVATFGAAIAGSWLGANATHRQTLTKIKLDRSRWRKERCFEFLEAADDFVNVSFRKDALLLHERDRLTRRLLTLSSFVIPEKTDAIEKLVYEVRNLHVGKRCALQFPAVEQFFSELRDELRVQLKELDN